MNSAYGAGAQFLYGGTAGASSASLVGANAVGAVGGDSIGALYSLNGGWAGVSTTTTAGAGAGASAGGLAAAAAPLAAMLAFVAIGGEIMKATRGETRYGGRYAIAGENGVTDPGTGYTSTLEGHYQGSDNTSNMLQRLFTDIKGVTSGSASSFVSSDNYTNAAPTVAGQAYYVAGPSGKLSTAQDKAMTDLLEATQAGINGMLAGIGSSATLTGLWGGFETSDKGRGGVMSGATLSNGQAIGESGAGSVYDGTLYEKTSTQSPDNATASANYLTDLKQLTLQALLAAATDVPKSIASLIPATSAELEALTDAQLDPLLATINQKIANVSALRTVLEGLPFKELKDLSFDAADGLIGLAGGLDALGNKLSSYAQNFYTEGERNALTLGNLTSALGELNLTMPTTRAAWRALMEAQDQNTEAGRSNYVALLNLSEAFASVTPAIEDAAAALASLQKTALDLATTGASTAYSALERAVNAEYSKAQLTTNLVTEQVNSIRSVFDVLKSNVQALNGQVDGSVSSQASQGQAFIQQALETARATGYLPDGDELTAAINAARAGIDSTQYSSQFEADVARLTLAGTLAQLQEVSGDQLTSAEEALLLAQKQVDALDGMLSLAKQQLDAANGLDVSVKSVAAALAAFNASLTALVGVRSEQGLTTGSVPAFANGGNHFGGLRVVGEYGPELEATGAARIWNANETRSMFSGGSNANNDALLDEVRQLREDNKAQALAFVTWQMRMSKVIENWDSRGMPEERETT